ncbi:DUF6318 family protein [Serinicoccus sp. LYQ131]|uniref:DUF6318 family protein n=1 Tax=Serinicoccus sp. LYQ131 TaxID=3378797 RepID=UPI0038531813
MVLAACDTSREPSAPPTSQDALTTVTSSQPEDEVVTSQPALTEEPETEEPEADGPPEMPAEAMEQTQAGAEAFVEHYVALINYTGSSPEIGLLEPLGGPSCESCRNHEASVEYAVENGDYLDKDTWSLGPVESSFSEDAARIQVDLSQGAQPYLRDGEPIDRALESAHETLIFRLDWDGSWRIQEITVNQ